MRFVVYSCCLGLFAISAVPLCISFSQSLGAWGATALLLAIEVALCTIWLRLSTARLVQLDMPKFWAVTLVVCWVLTIAIPMAMVFASPDSDDPGPVDAFILLVILALGSSLVSLVVVAALGFGEQKP